MHHNLMSRMFKWIAAAIVALGIIFCMANIAEFNDRNLGLMVGIGFLIGGLFVFLSGAAFSLLQQNAESISNPVRE